MTQDYYNTHAKEFAERTAGLCMDHLYRAFVELVPPPADILDAGCGPGRDALAFKRMGYRVTAMDASPAMATQAAATLGQHVLCRPFLEMPYENAFDGIWACASILHVPRREMDDVFRRFIRALRPNGVWYLSVKMGSGERIDQHGRLFNDYHPEDMEQLISVYSELALLRIWLSEDARPHIHERWVHVLVRKAAEHSA